MPQISQIRIIGIGNPTRGDDAAGRLAAQILSEMSLDAITISACNGETASILSCLEGADIAYLIDASVSGARPGTIRRIDVSSAPLPDFPATLSSHGFGLSEAIELARSLEILPKKSIVYAIEGRSFELGGSVSAEVEAAVSQAASRVRDEIYSKDRSCTKPASSKTSFEKLSN